MCVRRGRPYGAAASGFVDVGEVPGTMRYEIVIAVGTAGPSLLAALDGFSLRSSAPGSVRVVGDVADQAALHGALHRLHDLGGELVELRRVSDDEVGPPPEA